MRGGHLNLKFNDKGYILFEGDCFDYFHLIEDKSIDMILCDLPYSTTYCKWDCDFNLDKLWVEYKRIIKNDGAIVLFGSQPFTSKLVMSNPEMFRYEWIWVKNKGSGYLNVNHRPLKIHENILVFSKNKSVYNPIMRKGKPYKCKQGYNGNYTVFKGSKSKKEIITVNNGKRYPVSCIHNKIEVGLHPTQKPVKLCEYLIKTYTNKGDIVLDNCAGSGTTGVAAYNLGRRSIMMEKDSEYCKIIKDRMSEL